MDITTHLLRDIQSGRALGLPPAEPQPVTHDPTDLFHSQWAIRAAYHAVKRLRTYQADPFLQRMAEELDGMATELHAELEAAEPELPLDVRHPVLAAKVAREVPGYPRGGV